MKRYPAYKDSGVEWISKIPENWKVKYLKYAADKITKGTTPTTLGREFTTEGILFLKVESISDTFSIIEKKCAFIDQETQDLLKRSQLQHDDILIAIAGAIGRVGIIQTKHLPANCNQAVGIISLKKPQNYPKYLAYSLISDFVKHQYGVNTVQSAQANLSLEDVGLARIFDIPFDEQRLIVKYLDHKTHLIDTLIEKKQKQIELLKEQRAAIINQAVTKGLNPNVKMKDSGIEWLGDIPEGWSIRRFKTLFQIKKRIVKTLGFEVLSITQEGIKIKDIESGEGQLSTDYSKYQLVQKGDFAMNQMDLLTGFVDISKFNGVTSPDYRVFVLTEKDCSPEYLLYYLQMGYLNKLFFPFGHGAAHLGRWRLPTTEFKNFFAPCPPNNEQLQITEYIFNKTNQIDHHIEKISNITICLKEYRTTLISDVVTGKIDVRDEVIP